MAERSGWPPSTRLPASRGSDPRPRRCRHRADFESALVDRYFCNFSLFQSLPRQLGHRPALPDHADPPARREPTRRGTLQDVTCDSDGKIDRFVGGTRRPAVLELHEFRDGEDYILGIFLTGAYQEILGDLHNLFGDTNAVHVRWAMALRDHRPGARRHGDRGAQLRAVPCLATSGHVPPQGEGAPRGCHARRPICSSPITSRGWRATPTSRARPRDEVGPARFVDPVTTNPAVLGMPVHHVPEGAQVVGAAVLVLQVVGVFPHIDAEDGLGLAVHQRVVLVGCSHTSTCCMISIWRAHDGQLRRCWTPATPSRSRSAPCRRPGTAP
jgi:hypothetical protein